MSEMGSVEYAVFADKVTSPVLVTIDKNRALRALDALFDSREYVADRNRVQEGRIEVNGVVFERRSAHPALRMLEKKEPAIHHHPPPPQTLMHTVVHDKPTGPPKRDRW